MKDTPYRIIFFRDISVITMEVGGVRRSARLSTRKRHNSRSESHLACCFDNHSPSPKARKQEKMEGSSKTRTRFRKKVPKAPKVMVSRLPLAVRRPPVLHRGEYFSIGRDTCPHPTFLFSCSCIQIRVFHAEILVRNSYA